MSSLAEVLLQLEIVGAQDLGQIFGFNRKYNIVQQKDVPFIVFYLGSH
jgi:hypothetical protein